MANYARTAGPPRPGRAGTAGVCTSKPKKNEHNRFTFLAATGEMILFTNRTPKKCKSLSGTVVQQITLTRHGSVVIANLRTRAPLFRTVSQCLFAAVLNRDLSSLKINCSASVTKITIGEMSSNDLAGMTFAAKLRILYGKVCSRESFQFRHSYQNPFFYFFFDIHINYPNLIKNREKCVDFLVSGLRRCIKCP
jgi:hypothetical protein